VYLRISKKRDEFCCLSNCAEMGESSNGITNAGYVIIDRCYIHGLSTIETRRGVNLDLRLGTGAVIESVIEDIHESGSDSQAIAFIENDGPVLIRNNDLSASTEVFNVGSAVHQNGEFINGAKWLTFIVIARFRLPQLPFLGSMDKGK